MMCIRTSAHLPYASETSQPVLSCTHLRFSTVCAAFSCLKYACISLACRRWNSIVIPLPLQHKSVCSFCSNSHVRQVQLPTLLWWGTEETYEEEGASPSCGGEAGLTGLLSSGGASGRRGASGLTGLLNSGFLSSAPAQTATRLGAFCCSQDGCLKSVKTLPV